MDIESWHQFVENHGLLYVAAAFSCWFLLGLFFRKRQEDLEDEIYHMQGRQEEDEITSDEDRSIDTASVRLKSAMLDGKTSGVQRKVIRRLNADSDTKDTSLPSGVWVLYVMPKSEGLQFSGFQLLDALAGQDLQLNAQGFFACYFDEEAKKTSAFMVASVDKPGVFDMREPGQVSCSGLVFILKASGSADLSKAFVSFSSAAKAIADDLEGRLLDENKEPFTEAKKQKWARDVSAYQQDKAAIAETSE